MLIESGFITRIEPAGSCFDWDLAGDLESMDCSGKTAIPGFINMHTHAAMSMMRGIGEDMKFHDWLAHIWEVERKLDPDYVEAAAAVACLEMARTGTTVFNDQYWFFPSTLKSASRLGLRAFAGCVVMDMCDPAKIPEQKEIVLKSYEEAGDFPGFVLSCHAIYSVSEEMLVWAADFARKHSIRLHVHLSETRKEVEDCKAAHGGLSPVEYLNELGFLGPDVIAAHTLWLSEKDVELLGAAKVNCVHNINSNTKLASGYRFLYKELKEAGANICIGTDGCASSNNLDVLEALKTAALFQKAWRDDPTVLTVTELMEMATVNGARALGINAGKLKEGALADIAIVDTDNTFFLSPAPFEANLIYSAHSDCIDSLICGGRFIMRRREVEGEKEILMNARKQMQKFMQK